MSLLTMVAGTTVMEVEKTHDIYTEGTEPWCDCLLFAIVAMIALLCISFERWRCYMGWIC